MFYFAFSILNYWIIYSFKYLFFCWFLNAHNSNDHWWKRWLLLFPFDETCVYRLTITAVSAVAFLYSSALFHLDFFSFYKRKHNFLAVCLVLFAVCLYLRLNLKCLSKFFFRKFYFESFLILRLQNIIWTCVV